MKSLEDIPDDVAAPEGSASPEATPAVDPKVETPKPGTSKEPEGKREKDSFQPLEFNVKPEKEGVEGAKPDNTAELEARLQRERVEAGRLRKANEELAEERRKREELERKLQEIEDQRRKGSYLDMVPEDLRDVVDDSVIKASGSVTEGMIKQLRGEIAAEIEALKGESQQAKKAVADANAEAMHRWVNETYPGLARDTSNDGKLGEAWNLFLKSTDPVTGQPYAAVIGDAFQGNRKEGVKYVLDNFIDKAGISRRGGAEGTITPSGTATLTGGRSAPDDGRIYTESEYRQALEDSVRLSPEKRARVLQEMQAAANEGRVVRG